MLKQPMGFFFQTTATGIQLLLPVIYLKKLPNVSIPNIGTPSAFQAAGFELDKKGLGWGETRSSVPGRCEEKVQGNCEPPGNESPWAKASGIRVRRHTGLLSRVFTFPSRVRVGRADGGRKQAPRLGHAGNRLESILSKHFAAVPTLGGHRGEPEVLRELEGAQSEGKELRGAAG